MNLTLTDSIAELQQRILAGDLRAVARAATLIENRTAAGRELVASLSPHSGRAMIVGVTGPPGAGKSTLVSQLARLARESGQSVGIIAVDPSSPYSRGAILGDRIRMQDHFNDPGIFIRSMASRGAMGGLARATLEMALLLDAARRDVILIETVGAGQDEIDIARLAHITLVVLAPGFGDDVQAIKAGIMEIADVFAINKADLPGAGALEQAIRATQISVPIRRIIATEGKGCEELFQAIRELFQKLGRKQLARASSVELDHLGIAVKSIENQLPFYEHMLGMHVSKREAVESEHVSVAMLPAGTTLIELLEATDGESPIARFVEKRGPGLHHIALRVDDLAGAIERLKQNGARLLNEPRTGADGHTYVFVHPASTGGVLLELIQK
jgi:LAO/AO transport system kinase